MEQHPNWNALSTVDFKWKQFVREGCREGYANTHKPDGNQTVLKLNGQQARAAYEEVIKISVVKQDKAPQIISGEIRAHTLKVKHVPQICASPVQHSDEQMWKSRIMKDAQNNNVKGLYVLLENYSNVDFTDTYGWTPLMCAACAGSIDAVNFLIDYGANIKVKDKCGNNCLSLAKKNNHHAVVKAIERQMLAGPEHNRHAVVKSSKGQMHTGSELEDLSIIPKGNEEFYCKSCKQTFHDTSKHEHSTSTVHLFNSRPHLSCKTVYGIPENNKGYLILLKGGWDREQGLGPDGSGHKYPLKTVLKRDREGLGAKVGRPKVTHFQPRDTAAVRVETRKKVHKRQRATELCKEQRKERTFRREFYSSV